MKNSGCQASVEKAARSLSCTEAAITLQIVCGRLARSPGGNTTAASSEPNKNSAQLADQVKQALLEKLTNKGAGQRLADTAEAGQAVH